jgi:hypothetical protein
MLCLVGDVELYQVLSYGQILRRADFVYLARYKEDEENAARAALRESGKTGQFFPPVEGYVRKLKSAWPCRQVPPFENVIPQIIKSTVGLPGPIKRLLARCLVEQLWNGGEWKPEFFVDSVWPRAVVKKLESEVKEGEKFIKDNDWDVSVLDEQEQLDATVALTLSLGGSEQPPKPDVAGGKERGRDDH